MNYLQTEGDMSEPTGRRRRGWLAAITLLLPGFGACGPGRITEPSADLAGVWNLSYHTRAARACGPPAPPGLTPGCAGGGEATITQAGERIGGTLVLYGGCESCGSAADAFGNAATPVTGQLRGDRLELTTAFCRHSARVAPDASEVSGSVTCGYEEVTEGTWRMTRKQ